MIKFLSVTKSSPQEGGPVSLARDVFTQVRRPSKLLTALEYIGLRIGWEGEGNQEKLPGK